ncbi:hypothetical protein BBJ29_006542 [Phytophthora kernoviae]|uniref:Uncharacterized protein n=1 Tax=Phytophthora kernoviae TaxID=325452 RepID=A0A3F2RHY7_9STRA|nr:hypothetical protein BBP00_00007584 [Phytophthora kernoviae]RLN65210.1 hypothetical protein BBJ29_006542 [Phytophthora kernoviae]
MSRSPSREEFNDEGFEDDKPTPDVVDEYEEFENDEDPEEEKLVETKANAIPPAVSVSQSSTPSEPPASAREEDIEEEAEEEAYADDQDYNEFEEEDTPAPTSRKTTPLSEGEGDDYEDEEEYAEDEGEFEENSPRTKPTIAPVQSVSTTNKSDVDEIDDEVGYDSEYNESDD